MSKETEVTTIELGKFKIAHISAGVQRIEGRVSFNRENISQHFIFILMSITHDYGFACSQPFFMEDSSEMIFLIGTIIPTKRSVDKYCKKLYECLLEIENFSDHFEDQLDFSNLDISMFSDIDPYFFYPNKIIELRDQYYDGEWDLLYEDLMDKNKVDEAELIRKCVEFEETNGKNIGLVGNKLISTIMMLKNSKIHSVN